MKKQSSEYEQGYKYSDQLRPIFNPFGQHTNPKEWRKWKKGYEDGEGDDEQNNSGD